MKRKALSTLLVLLVVLFSISVCSAGLFNKAEKKAIKAVADKCEKDYRAASKKCHNDPNFKMVIDDECAEKALKKYDACFEPKNFKMEVKKEKALMKIEKMKDKCDSKYKKSIKKCKKKKGKKRNDCDGKALDNHLKCMVEVNKKMKEL